MSIRTIFTFDTEYSADAVEFAPRPLSEGNDAEEVTNVVAVGTYQVLQEQDLTQKMTQRKGRLLLFSVVKQLKPGDAVNEKQNEGFQV